MKLAQTLAIKDVLQTLENIKHVIMVLGKQNKPVCQDFHAHKVETSLFVRLS